jgi:hypothetical protein
MTANSYNQYVQKKVPSSRVRGSHAGGYEQFLSSSSR